MVGVPPTGGRRRRSGRGRTIDDSRSGRRARWSALDDVVNLEDVWRIGELDAGAGEDRHQTLAEGLELLPRVPDLADLKVAIRTEADVVVEPGRWPFAGVLELANRLVVLLGSESGGTEADLDQSKEGVLASIRGL